MAVHSYTSFEHFMAEVDAEIEAIIHFNSDDIADYAYRSAYDDGMSAQETAYDALENAGFPV